MEENTIDLKQYWLLIKRWAWLLILGLVLGAAAGYGASLVQTPVYQAVTKVMITSGGKADQSLDIYSSVYGAQLTQTYLELLQTKTVLAIVAERLGIDPKKMVSAARAISNTTIIEITADHTNPQMATSIANMLVTVLIEQNEKIQSGRYVLMTESLLAQKTQMEQQIATLQSQIDQASIKTIDEQKQWLQDQISGLKQESITLPEEITALTSPSTLEQRNDLEQKKARLDQVKLLLPLYEQSYTNLVVYGTKVDAAKGTANSQLSLLTSTQSLYQQIYVSVLNQLESVKLAGLQNTPNVVPIVSAVVPEDPIRPRPLLNAMLAGVVGLMLTTGILFLNEYLDNTVKTSEEIEQLSGLSVIGYIGKMQNKGIDETGTYVSKQPRSQIAEAFRSLRTNIEFASVAKPIKTILVTSPEPGTGKTTIAVNLAIIFAQKGRRVLLLDADLRRPQIHHMMNLKNRIGLTDLLLENPIEERVNQPVEGSKHLTVITSGSLPPNPAELLGSAKMEQILVEIRKAMDIVVIDSPPSILADVLVLAAKVDAVLLVIKPGKTQKAATKATIEQLTRANARIIGLVLNGISRDRGEYYSHYNYQSYQYLTPDQVSARGVNGQSNQKGNESRKPFFRRAK
jgi:succinoglycan biosynthesis transport protein ExoP